MNDEEREQLRMRFHEIGLAKDDYERRMLEDTALDLVNEITARVFEVGYERGAR
jgi:hypothetical protein